MRRKHTYIHAKYFHQFLIKSIYIYILRKTRTIHVGRNKKMFVHSQEIGPTRDIRNLSGAKV